MKKIIIIALVSFATTLIRAQLLLNDPVPDLRLRNLINYPRPELNLSEFAGKAILLEFWSFSCSVCIESFPKLDSLQEVWKDKIKIIAVNNSSLAQTKTFFANHKNIVLPKITFATSDSLLSKLFPRNFNPWLVWIDAKGIVKNITMAEFGISQDIPRFLKGQPLVSKEVHFFDNTNIDAVKRNKRPLINTKYYSSISRCVVEKSVGNVTSPARGGRLSELSRNCKSVLELVVDAFTNTGPARFFLGSTIQLQIKDSFAFIRPTDPTKLHAWEDSNSYNYELLIANKNKSELFDLYKQDILRAFNLSASITEVEEETPMLYRTRLNNPLEFPNDGSYRAIPTYQLLTFLRSKIADRSLPLFTSDSRLEDDRDVVYLSQDLFERTNIEQLKQELLMNGLAFKQVKNRFDVLTITKN